MALVMASDDDEESVWMRAYAGAVLVAQELGDIRRELTAIRKMTAKAWFKD